MKKVFIAVFLLICAFVFQSCDTENDPKVEIKPNINFDLAGAKAIILKKSTEHGNGRITNSENANLFKVDASGKISSVIDSINIAFARAFSEGLFVVTSDQRKFYVKLDNSYTEVQDEIGDYKGENEQGDLIFSDVSVLRANPFTLDKLQTTLESPIVQSISGNLAIITDNSTFQIFNTVTNIRYNINGCNGPRMEAFDNEKALIDDCQNKALIDMNTGARTAADINSWNNETLRVNDGIIVLTQGLSDTGDLSNSGLAHVDVNGNLTVLTDNIFQPGSQPCMNCGNPNEVLYGTGTFVVIRELNKVSVYNRVSHSVTSILEGLNVTGISVQGSLVYYLAEDNLGSPVTGIYNLETEENQTIDNENLYVEIQAFGK